MPKRKPHADDIPPEVLELLERHDEAFQRVHGEGAEPSDDDREELRAAENELNNLRTHLAENDAYQRAHAEVTISDQDAPASAAASEE